MVMNLIYHTIHTFYVNFSVSEAPNYFVGPKRKASRPLFNLFQQKTKIQYDYTKRGSKVNFESGKRTRYIVGV